MSECEPGRHGPLHDDLSQENATPSLRANQVPAFMGSAVMLIVFVALCLATMVACGPNSEELAAVGAPDWPESLKRWSWKSEQEFDTVPLYDVMGYEAGPDSAVLVDVRTAAEIAVSRIPGSLALPDAKQQDAFLAEPPDRAVIVYCTAGWRSGEFATRLRESGVEAFNLEGGICAWAIAGRPLLDAEDATTKRVHCYDDSMRDCVPGTHEAVTGE